MPWRLNLARTGVQAVIWAFGVAAVVSIVLMIASVDDSTREAGAAPPPTHAPRL